jgi:hypothetical protein
MNPHSLDLTNIQCAIRGQERLDTVEMVRVMRLLFYSERSNKAPSPS